MDLLQAIRTRHSTRRYAADAVSKESVEELLELSANAPSACDRRGWRCILVQNQEDLAWLYLRGGSSVLQHTAQALLVCYESETENRAWSDNIQSAAAFIAYFQLIAHDRGIGSCWICNLPPLNEVSNYFDIPPEYTPIAVITFGPYPGEGSLPPRANNGQVILAEDRWNFAAAEDNRSTVSAFRKQLRKIYFALPFRGFLRRWADRYEKKFDE
jgi:nitroreductase